MDLNNWKRISEGLSTTAPLVLYDWAGIGGSDDNKRLPSLKNRAEDLKNLLTALNVPPPYMLVGHSLGGVYIRSYAGLVFYHILTNFTHMTEKHNILFILISISDD